MTGPVVQGHIYILIIQLGTNCIIPNKAVFNKAQEYLRHILSESQSAYSKLIK